MIDVFSRLLNMSVTASILALTVIVLRFTLKKIPKKFICVLWALVAIRLICPISISSSVSFFNLMNTKLESSGQIQFFDYKTDDVNDKLVDKVKNTAKESGPSVNEVTNTSIDRQAVRKSFPIITYIWIVGAIFMLGYAGVRYHMLKVSISASINRKDNIYVCDEINSPFIFGIIKPGVYLPSGLDHNTEQYVIAHEYAHLKRRDQWWKLLGYMFLAIHWFNPVIWISYILFCSDIETACDEKVIVGMDKEDIAGYSAALLNCAMQRRMINFCPLAFGETNVKGRVKNVLQYKKPSFWIGCTAVVACIAVAVCFLTNPMNNNSQALAKPLKSNEANETKKPEYKASAVDALTKEEDSTTETILEESLEDAEKAEDISNITFEKNAENEAFGQLLWNTYRFGITGNSSSLEKEEYEAANFAIYDVDGDGSNELILEWLGNSSATTVGYIWGYNEGDTYLELTEFPLLTFYDNGTILAGWSHNPTITEDFWPYSVYTYNSDSDIYECAGAVEALNINLTDTDNSGQPINKALDKDSDGLLYYLMGADEIGVYDKTPVDGDEYEKWRANYFKNAKEINNIQFLPLTEENIEKLGATKPY